MISTSKKWFTDLLFLTLAGCIFYAIWLGSHALFTPDEGRYSEVAREMVATGDYITPRVNGVAFLDKPVLYYWLQASAIKLFGIQEWALRLWPMLLGIFGCIATYISGRLLFNRRTGILSAIILATSPLYYGAAHYANLDLEVAVFISCALLCFIIAIQTSHKKFLIPAYVFAGLAVLTKGLIGIAFPMIIIGAWIVIRNRWDILKKMRLIIGLLVFFAITLPWYVLVQKANPEFLHFFFITQQISRFLTTADFNNSNAPIWFYIPVILAGFIPWSLFIIQAIWKNRQEQATHLFLLIWIAVIFIFFSLPKAKIVGYILPIMPALALLIGNYLSHLKNTRISNIAFIILCSILFMIFITAPHIQIFGNIDHLSFYLKLIAYIFLIAGISACFLLRKNNFKLLFSCLVLTNIIFLLTINASTSALTQKSIKPLALYIKSHLQKTDEIATFYHYYQDLPIYTEHRVTIISDWHAADIEKYDNWERDLWYGMRFQNTSEWLINEKTFWQRWHSNKRVFVLMDSDDYSKFKIHSKRKIHKLGEYNNVILVCNTSAPLPVQY